ncbi:hypothetical protein [uncultured Chitinophaga sp.]|uniref:hypothetical protein n=1 Tax=uncultured Chitinophaga sp. TaxID=339340 RepID=UPI0025F8F346|nr:hypothetical protein [uncultured Chitinophaga sp.]
MKKTLALMTVLACLAVSNTSFAHAKSAPVTTKSAAFIDFPRGIDWHISFMAGSVVTLSWTNFSLPGLGPVAFTFQGNTQYFNPTTVTNTYWVPATPLTPFVTYNINIGGVLYYFYIDTMNQCYMTGHT